MKRESIKMVGSSGQHAGADLPWTTRSRIVPPRANVTCLPRTHLLTLIEERGQGGITLACAPPGFGKTLLSGLAYARLTSRKWTCAWLSVSTEHRSAGKFRSDLRNALAHAGLPVEKLNTECIGEPTSVEPEHAVLDALDRTPRRIALFLDGLERMIDSEALPCVARIAEHLPPNAHLMIASRRMPGLDLGRLQVAGKLLEVRPERLRFADDEASELLTGLLNSARVDDLVSTLEGWPVAVQLARLRLQQSPSNDATVAALLMDGPDTLGRYIDEQILSQLSTEAKSFLACAAELGTTSTELVDAARGQRDRHKIRNELTDLDPLIRLEAGTHSAFHAHNAILRRLRCLPVPDDTRRDLHARAADWLVGTGDAAGAVKHLVEAGDVARAVNLIERTGFLTLAADLGPATLNALVRLVPPNALTRLPRARLVWIAMLLNDGRHEEAAAEFQRALAEFRPVDPTTQAGLLRDIQLVESYFQTVQDRFPSSEELEQMSAEAPNVVGSEPAVILWRLSRADLVSAASEIEQLAGIVSRTGYRFDSACLAAYRGTIAFVTGNLEAAERSHSTAAALDPGAPTLRHSLMVDVPRAELYYERNALAQAADLISRHKEERCSLEEWFDIFVARHTLAAKLLHIRGDLDTAILLLRDEATAARFRGYSARHAALAGALVELLFQAGRTEEAIQAGHELPSSLSEIGAPASLPWRLIDSVLMARARLALARGEVDQALQIARDLRDKWDRVGLVRGTIRTHVLAAAAHSRLGAHKAADECLLQALDAARATRHLRVLLDERAVFAASLTRFTRGDSAPVISPRLRDFAGQLLRLLDTEERIFASGTTQPLSQRERDVLISLSQGQTNKMIALNCRITDNTVKYHLRHIYRKLKVRRRGQAIEEARRRSLIP